MKSAKFISIFILLLVAITLAAAALWWILLPQDVEDIVGVLRQRRNMELRQQPPAWMKEMLERHSNNSVGRTGENVLLNALGQMEVSGPENIMNYITHNSACKELRRHIIVFERYRAHLPDDELYVRLFKAIESFHAIYCGKDERYRKLFSRWQDELLGLHEQFVDCEGQPDWYENPNATTRCADAKVIMMCNVNSLRLEIGESVAKAWKFIFKSVLDKAMVQPCNFTKDEYFDGLGTGSAANSLNAGVALIVFILAVVFIF